MSRSYLFDFTTTLDRNNGSEEVETEVRVTCRVQSYAAAVGFGGESCSRRIVEITDTEHEGLPLSSDEIDVLEQRALDQLAYH